MVPLRPDWWRAYVGGDYLWRGRDPKAGVDCWGLHAWAMAHEFGRPVDDFGWAYPADGTEGRDQARARIEAELPGWREVAWEEGAAALFRVDGEPVHIGTCLARPGFVLHAHRRYGVDILDIPNSLKWRRRLVGTYLPA